MSKSHVSIIYLAGSFILIFTALAWGTSQVVAYFNSGANQKDLLLFSSKSVNEYYQPKVSWRPLQNQGRRMEEGTLTKLSKDYVAFFFCKVVAKTI